MRSIDGKPLQLQKARVVYRVLYCSQDGSMHGSSSLPGGGGMEEIYNSIYNGIIPATALQVTVS